MIKLVEVHCEYKSLSRSDPISAFSKAVSQLLAVQNLETLLSQKSLLYCFSHDLEQSGVMQINLALALASYVNFEYHKDLLDNNRNPTCHG